MQSVNYDDLLQPQVSSGCVAVAGGADISVLQMVRRAEGTNFILVGSKSSIEETAAPFAESPEDWNNCEIVEPQKAKPEDNEMVLCNTAAKLCKNGRAGVLMKGRVHTASFLRAILRRENGMLEAGSILSHSALFSRADGGSVADGKFGECFLVTDSAVNVAPNLDAKKKILSNIVRAIRVMGVEKPFIALLAPVEVWNSRIQSTTDARDLKKWLDGGALGPCVADGPLALDAAASAEAALAKGLNSAVAGRTDIYLAPNLDSANILYKALSVFAGFRLAAVLLGASVPVVLTSRSDNEETRRASLGLALRIAGGSSPG